MRIVSTQTSPLEGGSRVTPADVRVGRLSAAKLLSEDQTALTAQTDRDIDFIKFREVAAAPNSSGEIHCCQRRLKCVRR
jgi:hypothetical protein